MKWDSSSLLNNTRRRPSRSGKLANDNRNVFENDYGRIILSSGFRRLQDKAQVFPLDTSDFIRTRLTHSIEVAAIASSMGTSIERFLIKNKHMSLQHKGELKAILSSVGLLHDIGNTPFGHFGEYAIQQYFREFLKSNTHINKQLTALQKQDLQYFDGNAHSLRLITKLQYVQDIYGLNLTYATLAALIKYPCNSLEGNKKNKGVCLKKFGYFQSEQNTFTDIAKKTGLIQNNGVVCRHPLVFIMEAADDIAYSVTDLEDGIKKKVLSLNQIKRFLEKKLYTNEDGSARVMLPQEQEILNKLNLKIADDYPDNEARIIQILRAKIQGFMIESVVEEFENSYKDIINGSYNKELLNQSKASTIRNALKEISYIIFNNKVIITKELAGESVITNLLNLFVKGLTATDENNKLLFKKANTKENRLYRIISTNYRYIYEQHSKQSVYDRLLLITDFICGMTDYYAVDLFKKLSGTL
ncbi:deoxyguanosinetriphosphate triphosphohydrolase [Clostridium sp. 'deep sea']|uniref:deoxyguanosinetriphosphate triphosphohydrolase n=1 Tax=Clostridium sp. 'deep sea' TaxID=2779445 RepID=UPI0018964618|nr:deoxyguanosinetriphosphate triphosphohydrolase [Clostridium sp. 'deep sea']QOR36493.1 deoxyguanosinetriphosphate triphosphohydrolase [Clostridium sp. 'deep sea']